MTPVLNTPDRLVLRQRPWGLSILMAVMVLVFLGLALGAGTHGALRLAFALALVAAVSALALGLAARQEVAVLDRPSGSVALRSASLYGQRERLFPLAEVTGAGVETPASGAAGRAGVSRAVLRLSDGAVVPLTLAFTNGTGPRTAAETIAAWLALGPKALAPLDSTLPRA